MNEKNLKAEDLLKNEPKYPDRANDDTLDRNQANGVYAGPVCPPVMMTYAGPNMMNNSIESQIFSSVQPTQEFVQYAEPDKKICDLCGGINSQTAKFCCECGSPFNKEINKISNQP